MSDWPEHDKLHRVAEESHAIGYFIEMMGMQGLTICEYNPRSETYSPTSMNIHQMLAAHFNIDLVKLEDEKQQMLEQLRNVNREL